MSKESAMQAATTQIFNAPQPPVLQTTPAPAQPTKDMDSARFANLARKEAEIVKEKQALAAERDKFKPVFEQYQQYEKLKKENPVEALKVMGFNETDLFNFLASKEAPKELTPEEKAVKAAEEAAAVKIKSWEEEQAAKAKEQQAKHDAQLIQNFKTDITKELEGNKEKLEFCNYYGPAAEELIYETVVEALKSSGGKDLMTVQEAAELVENYYEEQDKAMSSLKKRKPIEEPKVEPKKTQERSRTVTTPDPSYNPKPLITKTRTLSSSATATSAGLATKRETASEKRARLERALATGDTSLLRK